MRLILKILIFTFAICGFALIRFFEQDLFYDPLLEFYKSNFSEKPFPKLDPLWYSFNLVFRYLLNTFLSLVLIWVTFKNKTYIIFSCLLYGVLFVISILSFWIIAFEISSENYMILFYIRRFLIQPLLVILLLPAFYFQNINKNAET